MSTRDAAILPQSSVSCQPRWPLLRKAPYVAEFIPVFRPRIGGNRSFRNNQLAVSFIDSVKHFATTHWRNSSQRCYLRQASATLESLATNIFYSLLHQQVSYSPCCTSRQTRHSPPSIAVCGIVSIVDEFIFCSSVTYSSIEKFLPFASYSDLRYL